MAGKRRRYWRDTAIAYLFLLPAAVIIFTFHLWPVVRSFWISLHDWRIRAETARFIGPANYQQVFQDDQFWSSLKVTVFYVVGTVPLQLVISLFIAYLLFQKVRGLGIYRTIYFLPYITSLVASAAVWATIFNPQHGLMNMVLGAIGIPPQRWLIEPKGVNELILGHFGLATPAWARGPSLALVGIMIFVIWQRLGFDVVIFLAGLGNVPSELYEAARIDGAGRWQLFRYVTIPLLSPTIFFLTLISVIGAFQAFTHIYTMNTAAAQVTGGPLGTTSTVTIYLVNWFRGEAVPRVSFGYASAIAFVLFFIILSLTLIQNRIGSRRVHYG
jgi:multiple sugar transport system permease protein